MAVFTAVEALEMAKEIERNGEAFYKAAAELASDTEIKELFEDLAVQEHAHYKIFQKMLDGLGSSPDLPPAEQEEYSAYVKVALDNALFAGPEKALAMAKEAVDRVSALRAAIGFEKDTMLFFYDLREMVGESQKESVTAVIREEKRHLRRLASFL